MMRVGLTAILLGLLAGTGCSAFLDEPSPEMPSQDKLQHSESMWGTWRVDQPSHARYEAEYLVIDGKNLAWRESDRCVTQIQECDVLKVRQSASAVSCQFARDRNDPPLASALSNAGEWFNVGQNDLYLQSVCSDGASRWVHVNLAQLANEPSQFDANIVSVAGEPGWQRVSGFQWRWTRCANPACDQP